MSPFRRKALENALVAVLRGVGGSAPSMKEIRPKMAEQLGGPVLLPELAVAVQSLRYQGKLEWERIELRESMKSAGGSTPADGPEATGGPISAAGPDDPEQDYPGEVNDEAVEGTPGNRPLPAKGAPGHEPLSVRPQQRPLPERGMEEPQPDRPGDQRTGAEGAGEAAAAGAATGASLRVQGGWHKASNAAGAKPLPVPAHEPEIQRLVREECDDAAERRRRARSTGTVRQPLELRKFGVRDMDLAEGVSSLLVEQPNDLMVAISRKHAELWKRVMLLGRSTGKRPAEALYAAIEAGLDELEAGTPAIDAAAA